MPNEYYGRRNILSDEGANGIWRMTQRGRVNGLPWQRAFNGSPVAQRFTAAARYGVAAHCWLGTSCNASGSAPVPHQAHFLHGDYRSRRSPRPCGGCCGCGKWDHTGNLSSCSHPASSTRRLFINHKHFNYSGFFFPFLSLMLLSELVWRRSPLWHRACGGDEGR